MSKSSVRCDVILLNSDFSYSIFTHKIERNDLDATLEKLKIQYPTLYIPAPADRGDGGNEPNGLTDDAKALNEATSVMEVSRLVTHLTRAVAAARERVSALMQEMHPLKEKMVLLNDGCDEKKKVLAAVLSLLPCARHTQIE